MRVLLVAATQINQSIPGYSPHHGEKPSWEAIERDSDELAEMAGRLCYESWDRPNPATANNRGYIANIISMGHFSVLEHASATFYIDGVSRNLTHELIRHRHLSFSEVSQRYVDVENFDFVDHPGLRQLGDIDLSVVRYEAEVAKTLYSRVVTLLTGKGLKRKEARQAARQVLPGGLETKILVTGNHRAWRDVLAKRLSPAADSEIREMSQKILVILKEIAPNTYQDMEVE